MDFHSLKQDQTHLVYLHTFLLDLFWYFHIVWICQRLSRNFWIPWNFWINLPSFHLKSACEVTVIVFLKNKQGIRACVLSNFHPGLEKMPIIWKIWNFHPGLKFHLGLAKPSWNFNSVYRVETFTCNCIVILKRSLLFTRDEISTRFNRLKFQSGLQISI